MPKQRVMTECYQNRWALQMNRNLLGSEMRYGPEENIEYSVRRWA